MVAIGFGIVPTLDHKYDKYMQVERALVHIYYAGKSKTKGGWIGTTKHIIFFTLLLNNHFVFSGIGLFDFAPLIVHLKPSPNRCMAYIKLEFLNYPLNCCCQVID
ncbi:hypothetical protein RF11_13420 [Thelohanellus kitauei]|uniref:Uncharacterized protein n=1 Tax=Thelohanellus kitauei TaxID=669202 RepID=A0A0C2N9F3_THEKT|nr:hypothetical protein RF11_13420 [Thelohanellus kitauei]